ncbi:SRPBCC family protein [candidate division KSB1 bacterium]|nr:SRPBCC family protein [candidate division KSB1 bacterium]
MPKSVQYIEILAPADKVWFLITDPKEFQLWAPNVRDLEYEPKGELNVGVTRRFRLDIQGKIETLETTITHCTDGETYAESPCGGSLKLHEKVEHLKMIYRVESVDAKTCTLRFTFDYEMKGFMNKMLEKVIMGTFTSQLKIWFERLKTYAETGRPV